MAMSSYYSNFPQAHPELAMELLGFQDTNDTICISDYHLFDPPPPDDYFSLSSEHLPTPEFDSYPYHQYQYQWLQYPKRQKTTPYFADHYDYPDYFMFTPPGSALDGRFIPNPPLLLTAAESCYDHLPLPDFTTPPVYDRGLLASSSAVDGEKKADGGGKCLSVQSLAARQRRRKISEKTQELGKLIPGGHKMNTAEMFQAAFKFVKYLQAQVGILESMGSIQDQNAEQYSGEELQAVLVGSPLIQEKLYSSENCVVPRQFVEAVAKDPKLQSNSLVVEGFEQFFKNSG